MFQLVLNFSIYLEKTIDCIFNRRLFRLQLQNHHIQELCNHTHNHCCHSLYCQNDCCFYYEIYVSKSSKFFLALYVFNLPIEIMKN